jgi:hypothetical protein
MGFASENLQAYYKFMSCELQTRVPTKRLVVIVILVLLSGLSFTTIAEAAMRKTLTPRISVEEQYDDNIYLLPEHEISDWITVVSPGISLDLETPETTMTLDYEAGFSFYEDDTDMNSTRHLARAEWNQPLTRYLRLQVTDVFVRSEDPIVETEGVIEDIRRERSIYNRNTGEVSLSHEFGAEDQITGGYRNRYVDDISRRDEDSQGHEGFLSLDKWFAPQYGIAITSSFGRGEFKQPEPAQDFDQYKGGLTLNYRWQPSRCLYGRYDFQYNDFEPPEANDYRVHQGALGVSLTLGANTDFNIDAGYFVQDYLNGYQIEGATFGGSLNTRMQRASIGLAGSGGYDQDYYTAENLGSFKFREFSGSADYLITENVRVFTSASHHRQEFFEADTPRDRKDKVWRGSAGISLSFWRYLTLSLEGTHLERDSDDRRVEFEDNRVMLRLTGAYPFRI